jgi:hypothetical protein
VHGRKSFSASNAAMLPVRAAPEGFQHATGVKIKAPVL